MKRRTMLKSLAAVAAARPLTDLSLFAQAPPIGEKEIAALKAMAEVVLPTALGSNGRDEAVARFVAWIRNYKEGADMGHSYGSSTLSRPSGALQIAGYAAQFAALDKAAAAEGAASFAALPAAKRRAIIETTLNQPQPVTRMSGRPSGANVIADLMGHYFNSAGARDLCYQAAIGRDTCRGLDGSDKPPAPLGRG